MIAYTGKVAQLCVLMHTTMYHSGLGVKKHLAKQLEEENKYERVHCGAK
jgi:hypothetical protein